MTTRESSRRSGFLTTVTLTPAEAETLAAASVDYADEAIRMGRDALGEFMETVIHPGIEPRWVTLADAISHFEGAVRTLRAVERLGGLEDEPADVVPIESGRPDGEAN